MRNIFAILFMIMAFSSQAQFSIQADFIVQVSDNSTKMTVYDDEVSPFWEDTFHGMPTIADRDSSRMDRYAQDYEIRKGYRDRYMSFMNTSFAAVDAIAHYPDSKHIVNNFSRGLIIKMPFGQYWRISKDTSFTEVDGDEGQYPTILFIQQYLVEGYDSQGNTIQVTYVQDINSAFEMVAFHSATISAQRHLSLEAQE